MDNIMVNNSKQKALYTKNYQKFI